MPQQRPLPDQQLPAAGFGHLPAGAHHDLPPVGDQRLVRVSSVRRPAAACRGDL